MSEINQSLPQAPPTPQPRVSVLSPDGRMGTMDAAEFPKYEAEGWTRHRVPGTVTSDSPTPRAGGALRSTLDAVGANAFQPALTGLAGATATHLFGVKDPEATEGEGFWKTYNRFKHRQQRDSLEMDRESPALRETGKLAGDLGVQAALMATGVGPLASVVGQSAATWGASAPGDIFSDEGKFNPEAAMTAAGRTVTGAGVGAGGYVAGKYVVGPAMNKVGGYIGGKVDDVAEAALNAGRFNKGGGYPQQRTQLSRLGKAAQEGRHATREMIDAIRDHESGMMPLPGQTENAIRTMLRDQQLQQGAQHAIAAQVEQMPSKLSKVATERAAYQAIDPEKIAQTIQQQVLAPSSALRGAARAVGRYAFAPALGIGVGSALQATTENAGLSGAAGAGTAAMFMRPGVRKSAGALLGSPSMKYNTLRIFQAALQRDPSMMGRIMGTAAMSLLNPSDDAGTIAAADYALSQTEPAFRQAKREQGGQK